MLTDNDPTLCPDVSALMEMTHEAMMLRWEQGLVTPMSSTISTFAKTDGSWWTATDAAWLRVPPSENSERLDFHHDRFGCIDQAQCPATKAVANPWDKRPAQSLFRS